MIGCFGKEVTQTVSVHISLARTGHTAAQPQEGGKVRLEMNERSMIVNPSEV